MGDRFQEETLKIILREGTMGDCSQEGTMGDYLREGTVRAVYGMSMGQFTGEVDETTVYGERWDDRVRERAVADCL